MVSRVARASIAPRLMARPSAPSRPDPALKLPFERQPSLPATFGNRVKVLIGGTEIFSSMAEAIGKAQRTVQVDIFLFGGKPGQTIVDALIRRKAELGGRLQVEFMADPHLGYFGPVKTQMKAAFAQLEAAGIPVRRFPLDQLPRYGWGRNVGQLDHDKALVVDGKTTFIGGMNWAGPAEANRDVVFRIQGPAAAQMGQVLHEDYVRAGGAAIVDPATGAAPSTGPGSAARAAGGAGVELTMTSGVRQDTKGRLLQLFDRATRSIYVGMYQFDDPEVADALVRAHQRGLDVRVLLARGDRYAKYLPVLGHLMNGMPNLAVAGQLIDAGVPVRWYDPASADDEMHSKYFTVDHEVAGTGSTNFTRKSFEIMRESEAFVHDAETAARLEGRMFLPDWLRQSSAASRLTLWQRVLGFLTRVARDTKLTIF